MLRSSRILSCRERLWKCSPAQRSGAGRLSRGSALHKLFFINPSAILKTLIGSDCRGPDRPCHRRDQEHTGSCLAYRGAVKARAGHDALPLETHPGRSRRCGSKWRSTRANISLFSGFTGRLHREKSVVFGHVDISTYRIEELLGTSFEHSTNGRKDETLRPVACLTSLEIDDRKVVKCFERYLEHEGNSISRAEFEKNMMPSSGPGIRRRYCSTPAVGRQLRGNCSRCGNP